MFISRISKAIRNQKISCSAVVLAAGNGTRFKADKVFCPLLDVPVLAYSLMTFESCDYISEIIVVTSQNNIIHAAELCDRFGVSKVTKIICGGSTRLESALSGISETNHNSNLIAIHDGARPLVSLKVIEDAVVCAYKNRAAASAIPARDTVKLTEGVNVLRTPDRPNVYCAQTPQVFVPEIIKGALSNALEKGLTIYDDASAVEELGFNVTLSPGSEENIKITTPLDMKLAETILLSRRESIKPVDSGEVCCQCE